MKNKIMFLGLVLAIGILQLSVSKAQFIEDALRYSQLNGTYTLRAGGLGAAFNGISDDIGAMGYNPAGIALMSKNEFSFGFGFEANNTTADFMGNSTNQTSNNGYLTHLGLVTPFRIGDHNAAFGIGYFMENNFDNTINLSGVNANSSFVNYMTKSGPGNGYGSYQDNLAYHLWLAGDNLITPVVGGNLQQNFIEERGGLHTITGAFAVQLSPMLTMGFTIAGKWGHYKYSSNFSETDINNIYTSKDSVYFPTDTTSPPSEVCDFNSLNYQTTIDQSVGGVSGSIGIMATPGNHFRIGASIKLPTYYTIEEVFTEYATATFDSPRSYFNNGKSPNPYDPDAMTNTYNILTPFVYSLGMSANAYNFTLAAGLEYMDASQLEFLNAPSALENLNQTMLQYLVGQVTWGIGAEYNVPVIPLVLRASYTSTSSPYKNDISGATLTKLAFGAGVYLAPNIRLDALVQSNKVSQLRQNYGVGESEYTYTMNPLNIGLQFTYRY